MHFYTMERIALFIDGANLYAASKTLSFDIDYKRLLALFRSRGQFARITTRRSPRSRNIPQYVLRSIGSTKAATPW